MALSLIALAVLAVGVMAYVTLIYNGLVSLKHNIDKSFSNIDVLLKQRYDEIPKLVEVCKGYMKHERETIEAVIRARRAAETASGSNAKLQREGALTNALKSLFAVVENYPELKADKAFLSLQNRISQLEDQIADRREFYNEAVNIYNIRIEQFPDVMIAGLFSFTSRELWKINPAERNDVKVELKAGNA